MKDEDKTKGQLINELLELRQRVAELKASETKSKWAEQVLQENKEKYRVLTESLPDAVYEFGLERNFIYVNDAATRMFGYSKDEVFSGIRVEDLIVEEDKVTSRKDIDKILKGKTIVGERTFIRKDGTKFVGEVHSGPIFNGKDVVGVRGILRDITERKQAEEEIRRLSSAVEQSIDGIAIGDLKPNLIYVNEAFARMHGYSPEEMVGMKVVNLHNDEQMDECERRINQIKTQGSWMGEIGHIRKDGTPFPTYMSVTLLKGDDGNPTGIVAVARDMSDRKRAEEKLRRQALIFENVHDGIIVTDLESHIIDWNRAAERIFGYSKEEVLGKTTGGITTDVVTATLRDGRWSGEINFMRKDGTEGVCETIIVPLHDGQGNTIATVGVNRDITDRKQAEGALRQSYQKLQRTFEETVNVLASAVEMRDPYTAGHQHRVTKLACAIAREMDFPEEQSEGLRLAATIHDIGKIYVPAEILSKPSQLGKIEYDLIRSHPQVGYEILNGIEFPWPVGQIVLQHHERLDGSGYPHGIAGDAIIREARILAVADVVEAMASHRPYRAARGTGDALEEILHNKGILYDPEVVDACLRVFYDKAFKFD